jgi:hypothetical protein
MNHITYIDRYFTAEDNKVVEVKEIRKSKVYGTYSCRYPSGMKTMIKVWNTRLNKMVSIRKDTELVEVID